MEHNGRNDWPYAVVWWAADMPEAMLERLMAALPTVRRDEVAACRTGAARRMAAGVSLLAYWALSRRRRLTTDSVTCLTTACMSSFLDGGLPDSLAGVDWRRGPHGQPMPAGVLLPDGRWHLSLSHSDGWVGVAVSDKPVGFDLQCRRPLPPHRLRRITERFHPTEAAALCALSPAAQADEFWRWWVLKESVLKLTGEGLTRPLASFCIRKEREAYATQIADKPVCLRTYVMPGDGPVMAAAIYGEQQGK